MSELVDWEPDSDYDVVNTNDPDGKKWQNMYIKNNPTFKRQGQDLRDDCDVMFRELFIKLDKLFT